MLITTPTRVWIKVTNSDIPETPTNRLVRLQTDFFAFLGRDFNSAIDYVHAPAVIDSSESQTAWLVIDLYVGEKGQNLSSIPISCYAASYDKGNPYVNVLSVEYVIDVIYFALTFNRVFTCQNYGLGKFNRMLRWGGPNSITHSEQRT